MLKIWDWMSGQILHEVQIFDVVAPFIRVRAQKRNQKGDDDGGEDTPQATSKGKLKQRKAKVRTRDDDTKSTKNAEEKTSSSFDIDPSLKTVNMDTRAERDDENHSVTSTTSDVVLVVHKIDTLNSEQGRHIIFSAVGSVYFCLIYRR